MTEADGIAAITATLTRVDATNLSAALAVAITATQPGKLSFPSTVNIPANQASTTFAIDTINNAVVDGAVDVNLAASAVGFDPASALVTVTDDDTASSKTIGGELTGSIAAGVYSVSHRILVPTGQVLTLMPGTEIEFSAAAQSLTVSGTLLAQGTPEQRITLRSASATPAAGDWKGVEILSSSSQLRSQLEQVVVQHAITGIAVGGSYPPLTVDNSEIRDSSGSGISVVDNNNANNLLVRRSVLTANAGSGVFLSATASGCNGAVVGITLEGNTISHNGLSGVSMGASASSGCLIGPGGATANPIISGNRIHNNLNGITGNASNSSNRAGHLEPQIVNNFIYDNLQDGVRLTTNSAQALFEPQILHNTIVRNGGDGVFHDPAPDADFRIFSNLIDGNLRGVNTGAGHQPLVDTVGFNNVFGNSGGDWNQYAAAFGDLTQTNAAGIAADTFMNVRQDPMLASDGLHLLVDSPMVGSGAVATNRLSVPAQDIDGNTRLTRPDIGADEVDKLELTLEPLGANDDTTTVVAGILQVRESLASNLTATVTRNVPDISGEQTITITNPDSTVFSLPATATIPAGAASVSFNVTLVDDGQIEPELDYDLPISASGFRSVRNTSIRVIDDEVLPATTAPDSETRINVQSANLTANDPSLTWLSADRYVTAWRGGNQSGGANIVAQIFNTQDQPVGDEILVGTLPTGWIDQHPRVAADALGNFVVAWTETTMAGTVHAIVSRHFDSAGVPLTAPATLPDPGGIEPLLVDLAMAQDGRWAIVYRDATARLLVQRFAADGAAILAPTVIATTDKFASLAALAYDDDNNLLVVWQQLASSSSNRGLRFQKFDAAADSWSPVVTLTSIPSSLYHLDPHISPADDGSFAVTWLERSGFNGSAFPWAQRWTADAVALTDAIQVSSIPATVSARLGSIASSANGDFALTWVASGDVHARLYHANGLPKGLAQVLSTATGIQSYPRIALAPDDSQYVVAWEGNGPDDTQGVFSRRLVVNRPTLTLTVDVSSLPEAGGLATATISRAGVNITDELTVSVTSSDNSAATAPASVTIPAGQLSVSFDVTAVDDSLPDGSQSVDIDVAAVGFPTVAQSLQVTDDDSTLTLTVSQSSISEAGGPASATATVSRNSGTGQPLIVDLMSSDSDEVTVPVQVTIPAGQASVTSDLDAIDETFVDGPQTVVLSASAEGHQPSDVSITVNDDDVPTLSLSLSLTEIAENAGADAAIGTVTRNTDPTEPLLVTILSSSITAATVPNQFTIPAGQASATFSIASVDDIFVDGVQAADISVRALGFIADTKPIEVSDDDVPFLRVTLDQTELAENAGTGATTVTVFRNSLTTDALEIDLSEHQADISIPAQITIPSGQRTATFMIDTIDDELVGGDRQQTITADAPGHAPGSATLTITEDDLPALTLSLDSAVVAEDDESGTTGTIFRNSATDAPLVVDLLSERDTDATVPAQVTILAGERTASFPIDIVNDDFYAGDRSLSISATAAAHRSAATTLTVNEDDAPPVVTLTADRLIVGEAANVATFTIALSAAVGVPVTVELHVDGAVSLAEDVTVDQTQVVIAPGAVSASFSVNVVQDTLAEVDEALIVEIIDVLDGRIAAPQQASVTIVDDDLPRDFGDAAARYPVGGAADGARHITGTLMLGNAVDGEGDGRPTPAADGDDGDDGVIFLTTILTSPTSSTTSGLLVTASEAGKLDAWIDFNDDGDWTDAGEQIFDSIDVQSGENLLNFTIPAGATAATTGARFRVSTAGGLAPLGASVDGEVEDYAVIIASASTNPALEIATPAGETDISTDGDELVISHGDVTFFQSPIDGLGNLELTGTSLDDILRLTIFDALVARKLHFDGGPGLDRLILNGADQTLDLTGESFALQNLELIDITGDGDNRLMIDTSTVTATASVGNPLGIIADLGDTIDFGSGWKAEVIQLIDGRLTHILTEAATGGTARILLQNDRMFLNPLNRFDADRNGSIQPLDALRIINELRRRGSGPILLPTSNEEIGRLYFDVNGDNLISALDALRVINALSRIHRGGSPEGEATPSLTTLAPSLRPVQDQDARPIGQQRIAPTTPTFPLSRPLTTQAIDPRAFVIDQIMQEHGIDDRLDEDGLISGLLNSAIHISGEIEPR
ncbi:MAG: GEVED domain-containing protein [Planctomycetaceae bacterium]